MHLRPARHSARSLACAAAAAAVLFSRTAAAQTPTGPEFRVNTYTTGSQWFSSVAADAAGNFVVVWQRPGSLAARRFDAAGSPLGVELTVATFATTTYSYPDVAGDGSGGFIVVWSAGTNYEILGRRYDATGSPLGGAFPVNTYTTNNQRCPSVAADGAGNFVVAWASEDGSDYIGISAQRFDSGGNRVGAEFAVNTYLEYATRPSVAVEASGGFVIVWFNLAPIGVYGQRFTSTGLRIGGEFQVSAPTLGFQLWSSVAARPGGGFVVVWDDNVENAASRVTARRYDSSGAALGPQFLVQAMTTTTWAPAAAFDGAGRFVVMWANYDADDPVSGIKARWFEADGTPRGGAFRVNESTTFRQTRVAVAAQPSGLVATWASGHEGLDLFAVFGQRFGRLGASALALDTAAGGGSNGNRVLEPGEPVDVRPSWTNNTGVPLDLVGAVTSVTGPPGATYTIVDGSGSYGTMPAGTPQPCLDCYRISVSAPANRPAFHWDAAAREVLDPADHGHTRWPLHIGDSFPDVPRASQFYPFVETLLHNGVTAGCGAGSYCPGVATTREQMAVFVLVAKEGPAARPWTCFQPMFNDVPQASPYCRWIEELARRGVVSGCGGGNYCPADPVSREQMAVFVLRTLDPALNPPACTTPVFNDVPASSPFCRWIEELARRGVVSGCAPNLYCPTAPVTREQMAVFLTGTFGLTLYGP